ncbi:MAG: hypothetical protein LUF68_06230, partial [Clostridiales bacterium]|nr:hypothetical protein [Clostridiales bacterium]
MDKSLKKRLLSLLLAFAMVCSFVSVPAMATDADLEITDVETVEAADGGDESAAEEESAEPDSIDASAEEESTEPASAEEEDAEPASADA